MIDPLKPIQPCLSAALILFELAETVACPLRATSWRYNFAADAKSAVPVEWAPQPERPGDGNLFSLRHAASGPR